MSFRVGWIDDCGLGLRALVLHDAELEETFEIQSVAAGSRDQTLNQDTYCLVRNGAAVTYGGIESSRLSGSRLTVTLTPKAADVLELPCVVLYDLDDEGLVLVEQRLHEILP